MLFSALCLRSCREEEEEEARPVGLLHTCTPLSHITHSIVFKSSWVADVRYIKKFLKIMGLDDQEALDEVSGML